MSVEMPPELAWVARLAVGQAWPKGDEDNLHALGQAWNDAAQELKGISGQIGASGNGVLESVGGQVADEFQAFVTQLESSLPEMAESANQLGKLGKHTAVQVEYSKYMIIGQLILLAAQIAEWIFFAPEVIPLAITAARVAVKMILRRLLISVATGVAMNVGLDVAVQTIQFLKGDRTEWSTDNTVSAVVSGAIGGAMGGLFFGVGSVLAPKFAHSLLGKGLLGAATGIGTSGIMYGIYHSGEDEFGTSISAGALGALGGGGKRRFGGKGDTVTVDPVHVNLPTALEVDLPGVVSAAKTELPGTDTFKEPAESTATAGTNGTGHTTGSAATTSPATGTAGTEHSASRTGSSAAVHETTHAASTPVTAGHENGLPGFTTTVTSASNTTPSTGGSTATRTGTAGITTRVTTGGGSASGTGTTAANGGRPTTTSGSGTATPTGSARPSTVSTGTDRGTGATGSASSVRSESGTPSAADTRPSTVSTGTDRGTGATGPASSTRAESGTPSAADTRTHAGPETAGPTEPTATASITEPEAGAGATAHETAAPARESETAAASGRPRHEDAAPVPDPTPPPGGHPAGSVPPPRMKLDRTPRIVVRSSFEARRFLYRGEPVTDLTVRVAFRNGGGGHDTDAVWAKVTAGVEAYFNAPEYHLPGPDHRPGTGDRLHVTAVRARPDEEAHLTVDLVDGDGVMDQRRWRTDAEPIVYAHELGHQVLNLRDEYRDEAVPHRPDVKGGLMGDFHTASPEGLRRGGLGDRHLQLSAAVVGDLRLEHPGLPHDAEWEQVRQAATPHKRAHTWVDPVSEPSRYEPLDGTGEKASADVEPRTTTQADLARALEAALGSRRKQDSDDESDPESEWSDAESDTPARRVPTAVPGPSRWMGPAPAPAPAHHTAGDGNGTDVAAGSPDRSASPESEERTAHTDATGQQPEADEAPVPTPSVPLLEALPAGPFEAHTLWADEPSFPLGLVVQENRSGQTISTLPVAYSHESDLAHLLADGGSGDWKLWEFRNRAHDALARAAEHRLRLITERAQEVVDSKETPARERQRAERLLKTETALEGGGWRAEYRSEFLRVQMLMGESDFVDRLPPELVVNEHWGDRTGSDADAVTSWALVSPDDPTGRIGGSLGGPDGVSAQFHTWLNENGGDSGWLAEWAAGQSAGSNTSPAQRFKVLMSHFHPARHDDGFYMARLDGMEVKNDEAHVPGHYDPMPVVSFAPEYVRSIVAQHVFTHEILNRVKMPNVDPERGVVRLLRLDKRSVVDDTNGGRTPDLHAQIDLRRGPADSYSLLAPYKDQSDTENHTLGAFWVTSQEIPLHQVFGTYLQRRAPISGEPEHTLFLYEPENEFLAMSDGVKADFYRTDLPPLLNVVREASAPPSDEFVPRAPVADGTSRRTSPSSPPDTPPHQAPHQAPPSVHAPSDTDVAAGSSRTVAPSLARSQYGMPEKNFDRFRDLARTRNLVIDVRPTNTAAPEWLDQGKLPKPKDIKAKSVNDLDVLLGAKAEHRGLIGYFEPVRPERGNLDDRTWEGLERRFAQRAEEFETLAPVMAGLVAEGRFKVENGLVYGRDGQGDWTEITGDHDVFDIHTPGGTRLAGEPYGEVVNTMMTTDMAVMHGAHMDWEPTTPFSKGIFSKIVESHQEGGEPLLRFRPGLNDAELVHAPAEFLLKAPEPARPDEPVTRHDGSPLPHPDIAPARSGSVLRPAEEPVPRPAWPPSESTAAVSATALAEPPLIRSDAPVTHLSSHPRVEQPALRAPESEQAPGARLGQPEVRPGTPPAQDPLADPLAEPFAEPPTEPPAEQVRPAAPVKAAEAEPKTVEPEGDPLSPPPPVDDQHRAGDPETADLPAPPPEPPGPPARLGGPHQRSLAGIRITDAPGPDDLRAQVVASLPAAHRTDRQVVQKLDAEFDPANFRARHEQMVNGGRRFQLRAGGDLHDVVLTARPGPWQLRADQAPAEEKEGKSFDRSAGAKRVAEPMKTALTTSKAGLDLAPTVILPDGSGGDRLGLITPSVKAGGSTHATDTSVNAGTETGTKTSLTGPTDTYVSAFHYESTVTGPDGRPLPRPAGAPLTADVTAEVTRTDPAPADGRAARWNGWESDHPDRAQGSPLDVTGLDALHEDVFRRLPDEGRPDGLAHNDILEFLSPKNVVDGFEHAAGWGLTSKRLDLSDGGHAWLRLTLEPGTSTREGTVADKDTVTSAETGEHATGRTDTSGWGLGLNGGGARRMWQSSTTKESSWLTVTGGYSYAYSQAHQEKGKQTFSLERSLEHQGTGDLIRTDVRFRLEVLRERLSPGTDGLHAVRAEPVPAPARDEAPRDAENPPAPRTGTVVRVVHHPSAPAADAPGSHTPAPAADSLRRPLTAARTAFVDLPGARQLEQHITDRLHELAPGTLPPPDGAAAGRITPQAMENQRLLRERLSRSGLRADGGQLLDGTFRITLDTSHLPGLPGRTYEVVVRADIGAGRHDGEAAGTAKDTVVRGHAADKAVTRGSKHTLGAGGNLRRALNPPDTVRAFGNLGVDGSYGPSRQTVASGETQAKRTFQHKGPADAFSYPVTYRVLVAPHREGTPPGTLPAERPAHGQGPDTVREVTLAGDDRMRVEVRRTERSASAPRYLRPARLPQSHAVTHVTDEAGFQRQARAALEAAYRSREPDVEPPRVPELDAAVTSLAGRAQLPGLVSASHSGWANTLDRHVGAGRAPDTVGLSVRTRLIDLHYEETLSGDNTLDLELKASGATTVADQTSSSVKGSLGPDFGLFPETATGALTTTFQVRGGGKGKAGGQWDQVDTLKQQTATTRKVSHTGTWHVYRATAEVSIAGRLTEASGASHVGRPIRHHHDIHVLLSDEDVTRLHSAALTDPAALPPERRATLLDLGISGGALVELPGTDAVLQEIDRQLRGPDAGTVPVSALPFADAYSPDTLAARYDELVGPGILERHVEVTRAGHVVTEVLVRGITDGWRDDGSRSDRPLTRDVTAAHTVKGKAGAKGSLGVEANLRASVRPPAVPHLNSISITPAGGLEGGRGSSAESGVTTTVGHKTSGYGDTNARFTTGLSYEVTVTRRTETGRFVHLPEEPRTIGPYGASAWVPESLTESATAPPHPHAPGDEARPAPLAEHPFAIELDPRPGPGPAERLGWHNALREGHDLVGFDNAKSLHDTAVQVQATPRPWGDGLLGHLGTYYSWALSQGADLTRWAARSTLPTQLTDTVSRFVDTFTADPRLGHEHDLSQEQRLSLEEQFAIRQVFSGQSLPALFHRLNTPGTEYRVPGTSIALSMEAIGPPQEVGHRDTADDELSVAVTGESATAATNTYNWSVSPLDLAVLTEDPAGSIPLSTARMTRDATFDSTRPVTRTPGTPSRPTPNAEPPHGIAATEPGKAKLTGAASLMRQPVRFTVRAHDDSGPYGTPRTVTGHIFHWTTPRDRATPSASGSATALASGSTRHPGTSSASSSMVPPAPGSARRTGALSASRSFAPSPFGVPRRPAASSLAGSLHRPAVPSSLGPSRRRNAPSPSGSTENSAAPSPLGPPRRAPAAAPPSRLAPPNSRPAEASSSESVSSAPRPTDAGTSDSGSRVPRPADAGSPEFAPRAPRPGAVATAPHPAHTEPTAPAHTEPPAPAATPALTRGIAFSAEDVTTPGPAETAHVDALAAEVADDAVRRVASGLGLPAVLVTGHGTASVSGLPHFGRAVQVGAGRAESVRALFARRLDAHLRDLGSPLTSDAFTITAESRGPDLPHGTDPTQDTPEARRRAVITVTHPQATEHEPSVAGEHPADHGTASPAPSHAAQAPASAVPSVPPSDGRPPLRPEQWRARRAQAAWAVVRTEQYDPARDPLAERPGPGLLAGRDVVVRAAVARIQADDGRWVRNLSLHLPVRFGDGFGPADLASYRERLQSLLDTHVNDGRRLPGSGDQLHIDVDLEHRPDHPEAVEISRSEAPQRAWDQFTFPLGEHEGVRDEARALHELLHYSGLPDRYHDVTTLFRRREGQSDRTGLMADVDTIDVPDAYLRTIAEVTESGPVLRDLPYTGGDGKPGVAAPGLTGAAAREVLLGVERDTSAPARPPAAAPFANLSDAKVRELTRQVWGEGTELTGGGRNWRGIARPAFDPTRYHVHQDAGERTVHAMPWAEGSYVVLARAGNGHITLETPGGEFRLARVEDFVHLVVNDPHRPPDADIVLAVRGLPADAFGLPQAVFAATGNRVWSPSGGDADLTRVVRGKVKLERIRLAGRDPHWAPTTSAAGPDHFAHLRPQRLTTDEYSVRFTGDEAVLFHRLPATQLTADPVGSEATPLYLPTQELGVVPVQDFPAIHVSQDHTLAIDAGGLSQHAYATEQAVDQANAKLAAAGSSVRLKADPEISLTFTRGDTLPTPPLLQVTPRFLTRSERSEEETCRDFAQMVSGQLRASHVVFRVPGRVSTGRISALDTAEVTGTHHLAESLAEVADGHTDPAVTGPSWAAAQIARDNRGVGGQGGAPMPGREYGSALSYEYVDDPRRDAVTRAALQTGINEGAWAEVGEGYLVQSISAADDEGKPTLAVNYAKPTASNTSHFGYHFATVVLASEDGQSQLTLENHARVSRNKAEMNAAVEENLSSSATELRALAARLHERARFAGQVGADPAWQDALKSRARLADSLVTAREARDRGDSEEEQNRTFQQAARAMPQVASMIDGKHQWYFRSYSRRPGESMHESHAELLSDDHASAEANPLTLVVLHGHAVSAPEHRFIPFEESGALADSAGYKLDHLAEHIVRTGLWNLAHGLRLPSVRLAGHGGASDLDRDLTMAARIRDELRNRIATLLHDRGATTTADAFTISIAAAVHRADRQTRSPQVTFEVDHWRNLQDDDPVSQDR
ncbi:WXG100-like domain-containing protein [Streptomyces sp. NBC_00696]|uniref:WXG100-like domain-containing protein n=1 Tax=Streptomyces sp. NBC_00696 TaxID=2903672 RepID=UPI002E31436F|nr:hypothetical protein [Streptomyces sp. NBC_00696]